MFQKGLDLTIKERLPVRSIHYCFYVSPEPYILAVYLLLLLLLLL